jgi:hypothetical protein
MGLHPAAGQERFRSRAAAPAMPLCQVCHP